MRWLILALALICSQAHAQTLNLLGAGSTAPVAAASGYQGPGDVFAGAFFWGSCARAYTVAFAATAAAICDLVDTPTGTAACTLKIGTNGFADLTSVVCPTSAPTQNVVDWCTTVTACSVTKVYDQTGSGNHMVQATLANMPGITVSGLNSLPVLNCGTAATLFLATAGTFTLSIPFTLSTVYIRTTGTNGGGNGGSNLIWVGSSSTGNNALVTGAATLSAAATDSVWHGLNGMINGTGTSSAINVDGTDATGNAGASGLAGITLRMCRAGQQLLGSTAEFGIWNLSSTSTDRGNLYSNQHGTNGYNGAV